MSMLSIEEISRKLTEALVAARPTGRHIGRPTPHKTINCLTASTDSNWSFRVRTRLGRQPGLEGILQKVLMLGRPAQAYVEVELTVHAAGQDIVRHGSAMGTDEGWLSLKELEEAALAEAILTLWKSSP